MYFCKQTVLNINCQLILFISVDRIYSTMKNYCSAVNNKELRCGSEQRLQFWFTFTRTDS